MVPAAFTTVLSRSSRTAPEPLVARREGPSEPVVIDAWCSGKIEPEHAEILAEWVRKPGPWLDGYRAALAGFAQAGVPRFDTARSTSVAVSHAELGHARLVQNLPMVHLGPQARREGRLTATGVHWSLVEASASREVVTPYGATSITWSDDVVGEIVTTLIDLPVAPVREAEDAMASVVRLADGLDHPRALEIALAVAGDLRAGALHAGLAASAQALDEGQLEAEAEIRWVVCALWTHLELERLGHRLNDESLDAARAAADAALAPHARGLLLLDDDHYRDMTRGYDIDPEAWYGLLVRLDCDVPAHEMGF